MQNLVSSIEDRSASIAVIGLGYVGLPLAVSFAEAGFRVLGIDLDQGLISDLNQGKSRIGRVSSVRLTEVLNECNLSFEKDYWKVDTCDVVLVCVPTPLSSNYVPDMSYVENAVKDVSIFVDRPRLLCIESTIYPGAIENVVRPLWETGDYVVGENCFLAHSPEREDPGNDQFDLRRIPKLVGGCTPNCTSVAEALYLTVVDKVIPVSSPMIAEMAKCQENIFRAVNVALANEMKIICEGLGVNPWEVLDAASTKPFGFMRFAPGPGLGGHCLPIDPWYLIYAARQANMKMPRLVELAAEINATMPYRVVEKVKDAVGENDGARSLVELAAEINATMPYRVLILGVAYKRDVGDTRESPALKIIEILDDSGMIVAYHDPFVPRLVIGDIVRDSVPLSAVKEADCVVIVTDHSSIDYDYVVQNAKIVVDTRGVIEGNVIRA